MRTRPWFVIAAGLILLRASGPAASAQWPQFRGPQASGVDASVALPTNWNATTGQNILWKTPIVIGGLLYGCADTGLLTCFDAKTGEVRFSERLSTASEGYTASPVSDGRHLYLTSELGNVFVVPATATFSIAAKNELGETCLSTPALAAGTLFFRTRGHLVAVGTK